VCDLLRNQLCSSVYNFKKVFFWFSRQQQGQIFSGMGEWQCGVGDFEGTPMFGSCYADPNIMPFFLVLEGFVARGLKGP